MIIDLQIGPDHIEERVRRKCGFLSRILHNHHKHRTPLSYQLLVDHLRIIPRTSDPNLFDQLWQFFDPEHTSQIELRIYRGKSYHNVKHRIRIQHREDSPDKTIAHIEQLTAANQKLTETLQSLSADYEQLQGRNRDLEKELQSLRAHKNLDWLGRSVEQPTPAPAKRKPTRFKLR